MALNKVVAVLSSLVISAPVTLSFDDYSINPQLCELVDQKYGSQCPENKFARGLKTVEEEGIFANSAPIFDVKLECCLYVTNDNEYLTDSPEMIESTTWNQQTEYEGVNFAHKFAINGFTCRGDSCDLFKTKFGEPMLRSSLCSLGFPKTVKTISDDNIYRCSMNEIMADVAFENGKAYPVCRVIKTSCPSNTTASVDIFDRCLCDDGLFEVFNQCTQSYCQKACIECPTGHYCTEGKSIECPAGFYCVSGELMQCPLGKSSDPQSHKCYDLEEGCELLLDAEDRTVCKACSSDYYLDNDGKCIAHDFKVVFDGVGTLQIEFLLINPKHPSSIMIELALTNAPIANQFGEFTEQEDSRPDYREDRTTFGAIKGLAVLNDGYIRLTEIEGIVDYSFTVHLKYIPPGHSYLLWSRIVSPILGKEKLYIKKDVTLICSCEDGGLIEFNSPTEFKGEMMGSKYCLMWMDNSYCDIHHTITRKSKDKNELGFYNAKSSKCANLDDCQNEKQCVMQAPSDACLDLFKVKYNSGEQITFKLTAKYRSDVADASIEHFFTVPTIMRVKVQSSRPEIVLAVSVGAKQILMQDLHTRDLEPHRVQPPFDMDSLSIVLSNSQIPKGSKTVSIKPYYRNSAGLQPMDCTGCSFALKHNGHVEIIVNDKRQLDFIGARVTTDPKLQMDCEIPNVELCLGDQCKKTNNRGYTYFEIEREPVSRLRYTGRQHNGKGVCRLKDLQDKGSQGNDFQVTTSDSEENCLEECNSMNKCVAYEYSFAGGRCELWTTIPPLVSASANHRCKVKDYDDDDYKYTNQLTGCENPYYNGWWRTKDDFGLANMYETCMAAKAGTATPSQLKQCCMDNICKPAKCTKQEVITIAPTDQDYMHTFQVTGCEHPADNIAYWKLQKDNGVFNMFRYCTLVKSGKATKHHLNTCCGAGKTCKPKECKLQTKISKSPNVYSDADFMYTFQTTGCPRASYHPNWRKFDDLGMKDMYDYCNLNRAGTADARQRDFCCGNGQHCKPVCQKQVQIVSAPRAIKMKTSQPMFEGTMFQAAPLEHLDFDMGLTRLVRTDTSFEISTHGFDIFSVVAFYLQETAEVQYTFGGGQCNLPIGGFFSITNKYCPDWTMISELKVTETSKVETLPALPNYSINYIGRGLEGEFEDKLEKYFFKHNSHKQFDLYDQGLKGSKESSLEYYYETDYDYEVWVDNAIECSNAFVINSEIVYDVFVKISQNYSGTFCDTFGGQQSISIKELDGESICHKMKDGSCVFDGEKLSDGEIRFKVKSSMPKLTGDHMKRIAFMVSSPVANLRIVIPFLTDGLIKDQSFETLILPLPSYLPLVVLHKPPGDQSKTAMTGDRNYKDYSMKVIINDIPYTLLVRNNQDQSGKNKQDIFFSPSSPFYNEVLNTNSLFFRDRTFDWETKHGEGDSFVLFNDVNIELYKAKVLEVKMASGDLELPYCSAEVYESIAWEFEAIKEKKAYFKVLTEKDINESIQNGTYVGDMKEAFKNLLQMNKENVKDSNSFHQLLTTYYDDNVDIIENLHSCFPDANAEFLSSLQLSLNECKDEARLYSHIQERVCALKSGQDATDALSDGNEVLCALSTAEMHFQLCGEGFSCSDRNVILDHNGEDVRVAQDMTGMEPIQIIGGAHEKTFHVHFQNSASDKSLVFTPFQVKEVASFLGYDGLFNDIQFELTTILSDVSTEVTFMDADKGDEIFLLTHVDDMFGTPSFEVISGATSCPRESGTESREKTTFVYKRNDAKSETFLDLTKHQIVEFDIQILSCNISITSDYVFTVANAEGLIVESKHIPFEEAFTLAPNTTLFTTIVLKRDPTSSVYDFSNVKFQLNSVCNIQSYHEEGDDFIGDENTLLLDLNAHYLRECAQLDFDLMDGNNEINIRKPALGEQEVSLLNISVHGEKMFTDISILDYVKLQYRHITFSAEVTPWIDAGHLKSAHSSRKSASGYIYSKQDNIDLQTTADNVNLYWSTKHLADGHYELRLLSSCSYNERLENATASDTTMLVQVDRTPPMLTNIPIFDHMMQIRYTFNEVLSCDRAHGIPYYATFSFESDKSIEYSYNMNRQELHNDIMMMSSTCAFNYIQLRMSAEFPFYKLAHKDTLHLKMCNVQDAIGNSPEECFLSSFQFEKDIESVTTAIVLHVNTISEGSLAAQLITLFTQMKIDKSLYSIDEVIFLNKDNEVSRIGQEKQFSQNLYTDLHLDYMYDNEKEDMNNLARVLLTFSSWKDLHKFFTILKSENSRDFFLLKQMKHVEGFPILDIQSQMEDVKDEVHKELPKRPSTILPKKDPTTPPGSFVNNHVVHHSSSSSSSSLNDSDDLDDSDGSTQNTDTSSTHEPVNKHSPASKIFVILAVGVVGLVCLIIVSAMVGILYMRFKKRRDAEMVIYNLLNAEDINENAMY